MKAFIKQYAAEAVILLAQLLVYYVSPLFAGPTDAMAMVLLIALATLLLGFVAGAVLKRRIKFLYPFAAALLFLPSVPLYYNSSALVHAWWYFVLSAAGLLAAALLSAAVRALVRKAGGERTPAPANKDEETDL